MRKMCKLTLPSKYGTFTLLSIIQFRVHWDIINYDTNKKGVKVSMLCLKSSYVSLYSFTSPNPQMKMLSASFVYRHLHL